MSPGENPPTQDITVGPALVAVPADWTVGSSPTEGLIVLHKSTDSGPGEDAQPEPGVIQPNLVLSFMENPASQGGVAQTAAVQLHTVLHRAPGTTLLAMTAFTTATGLPGRAHVVSGLHRRTPFQSSRWYVGVGDVVVEIVLTLPAEPQPDLLATGTAAAYSVGSADPAHTEELGHLSQPVIPQRRIDQVLRQRLSDEDVAESTKTLEDVAEIVSDVPRGRLPAQSLALSPEAADKLIVLVQVGNTSRFSAGTAPEIRELQEAGLHTGAELSELGEHITGGVDGEPDLHLVSRVAQEQSVAQVWIDHNEATLMLQGPEHTDVLRELAASVPAILLAWSGRHGGWFVDAAAQLPAASLDQLLDGGDHESRRQLLSAQPHDGDYLADAFGEPAAHFTCTVGTTGSALEWVHTARRGPFMIEDADDPDRLRLSSATSSVLYDYLVKLTQWVQQHGSA